MTWEYKIEVEDRDSELYMGDASLNALGLQGWELVSVTPETDDYNACFYFKRLIPPPKLPYHQDP